MGNTLRKLQQQLQNVLRNMEICSLPFIPSRKTLFYSQKSQVRQFLTLYLQVPMMIQLKYCPHGLLRNSFSYPLQSNLHFFIFRLRQLEDQLNFQLNIGYSTSIRLLIIQLCQHMDNKSDQHGKHNLNNHNGSIYIHIIIIVEMRRTKVKVPNHFRQYSKTMIKLCFVIIIKRGSFVMSHGYGFLTQSSIIPKKSKEIKINDNSGQILLESIIQKQRQKLKNKAKIQEKIVHPPTVPKRNHGIQQRIRRDKQQQLKTKNPQKNSYKILEKKAEIYDKITNKKINIDKILVDFQAKSLQMNKQQAEEYNKIREAFYKGQINDIESQQKSLHEAVQAQTNTTTQLRQRLTWEKQALNQLKGIETQQKQSRVHQSFDNVLSKQQREAFQKIINQEEEEKNRIQLIRRKRQMVEQERIRKLRKLNVIKDVTQAIHQKQITKKQQ